MVAAVRVLGEATFTWRALLPAASYVLSLALISAAGRAVFGATWRRLWRPVDAPDVLPLSIDGAAWVLGTLAVDIASELGWGQVVPVLLALALLGAEAARNAIARGASDERVGEFERLHRAHERILGETSGMGAVADQVLVECSNILPVYWYQFELEPAPDLPEDEPERRSAELGGWA